MGGAPSWPDAWTPLPLPWARLRSATKYYLLPVVAFPPTEAGPVRSSPSSPAAESRQGPVLFWASPLQEKHIFLEEWEKQMEVGGQTMQILLWGRIWFEVHFSSHGATLNLPVLTLSPVPLSWWKSHIRKNKASTFPSTGRPQFQNFPQPIMLFHMWSFTTSVKTLGVSSKKGAMQSLLIERYYLLYQQPCPFPQGEVEPASSTGVWCGRSAGPPGTHPNGGWAHLPQV